MGMSTHAVGFKPPDEKWKKMKQVFDACREAKIDVPRDVARFFNDAEPDEAGVEISEKALLECGALREWDNSNARSGFEIDVKKLPTDVTVIRIYNAW